MVYLNFVVIGKGGTDRNFVRKETNPKPYKGNAGIFLLGALALPTSRKIVTIFDH